MKILLVDNAITGHHRSYLEAFLKYSDQDTQYVSVGPDNYRPDTMFSTMSRYYSYSLKDANPWDALIDYRKWMAFIKNVIIFEKPDVVHFLTGDRLYRYFGFYISKLSQYCPVIITFHQMRKGFLRQLSYRMIARHAYSIVVHTDKLANDLREVRVRNVRTIDYPKLDQGESISVTEARRRLGITTFSDAKTLLAIGNTRHDKGLDILLDALMEVDEQYNLIIAGKPETFGEDYVNDRIKDLKGNCYVLLAFLTDEQFSLCLHAADIIVLPYRKIFDGASGPLGEGVWLEKEIIGPSHGSLGEIIREYHLGETFETENTKELSKAIENALSSDFVIDDAYRAYVDKMDPWNFVAKYRTLYEESSELDREKGYK